MTCEPFCDRCGGTLGHPANGDWLCDACKAILAKAKANMIVAAVCDRLARKQELRRG